MHCHQYRKLWLLLLSWPSSALWLMFLLEVKNNIAILDDFYNKHDFNRLFSKSNKQVPREESALTPSTCPSLSWNASLVTTLWLCARRTLLVLVWTWYVFAILHLSLKRLEESTSDSNWHDSFYLLSLPLIWELVLVRWVGLRILSNSLTHSKLTEIFFVFWDSNLTNTSNSQKKGCRFSGLRNW